MNLMYGDVMKEIPLTGGAPAFIDDDDYPLVSRYRWRPFETRGKIYAKAHGFKPIIMHRLILGTPPRIEVDHLDGDGLNNRKSNLRLCTHKNNIRYQRIQSRSRSGFKGVSWNPPNWGARITVDGVCLYLGSRKTKEGAARLYDAAATKYFGKFALTNDMMGKYK